MAGPPDDPSFDPAAESGSAESGGAESGSAESGSTESGSARSGDGRAAVKTVTAPDAAMADAMRRAGGEFTGASPAAQIAVFQQDNVNLLAMLSDLQVAIQQIQDVGGVGGGAALGGTSVGLSEADRERCVAKAEFEATDLAWRSFPLPWAQRRQRGIDFSKEMLVTVLVFGTPAALEAAMLQGRTPIRMRLLMHHGDFAGATSRAIRADLPNASFR
eukprot:g21075.t1